MLIQAIPNVGSSYTLVDGTTVDDQRPLFGEAELGNAVWEHAYSGPRGTQGSRPASGVPANRPLVLPFRVYGTSKDDLATNISRLQEVCDRLRRFGGRVKWQSNNQTSAQYFEVMEGQLALTEWGGSAEVHNRANFTISAVCAPYLTGDTLGATDAFSTDTIAKYTFDTGGGTASVTGGALTPSSTAEKRLYRNDLGFDPGDVELTLKHTTGTTLGADRTALMLRRLDANNYLDGICSFALNTLRIRKIVAGVATDLASVAISAGATSTAYWLRFRAEGNLLTLEHFTSAPSTGAAAATSTTHTLAGGDATTFGAGITGTVGIANWTPGHTTATVDDLEIAPFVYRAQTLPATFQLGGTIPGDAPALADVSITTTGGSSAPVWALVGWSSRASTPLSSSVTPFGIIEAETATDLSGWATSADAAARGGSKLIVTTSGAATYTAAWAIDPSTLAPDDYTLGELAIELWARTVVDVGVVSPTLIASVRPEDGTSFGAERFTNEWGSTGKLVPQGSTGSVWRFVRLGTLPLVTDPAAPRRWKLWLTGTCAAGSTGTFGLDYLCLARAKQRALSPTAKTLDSTYPKFIASTSNTTKRIGPDLSGAVNSGGYGVAYQHPDHGLGGNLLELPAGNVDVVVKLSSLVPDDPTSSASSATEQLSHTSSTVRFDVAPRWAYLKPS